MIQPGKYLARAIPDSVQFGRAETGTEQIAITFQILDSQTQKESGDEITWIGAMGNEKSLEITAKALRACGCTDPEELDRNPGSIAKNVVELDIQNETYQGKTRLRVKWVNSPHRFSFKTALDAGSKASALARLKGYSAKEAAAMAPAAVAVEDLPF